MEKISIVKVPPESMIHKLGIDIVQISYLLTIHDHLPILLDAKSSVVK
jgi:hypothetical protein